MKVRVTSEVSINGQPQKVGIIVDVDDNTGANLMRKGRVVPVGDEAPEPLKQDPELSNRAHQPKPKSK